MVEFRILGPLEASRDGRPVRLGHGKQRAVLGLLLLRANEVVSSERLIDELWGADPPETAHAALRNLVSQLRRAFASDGLIVTRPPGYVLEVDPSSVDAFRFEQLLAEGREALAAGDAAEAAGLLREACGLWSGHALADVTLESANGGVRRLEDLRLQAAEERIEAELALGRHDEVIPELEALVAEEPYRERLRLLLMRALYRSGRQAEALEVYRRTRKTLAGELGIEPGPALQQLERAILRQDPELAPTAHTSRRKRRTWIAGAGVAAALLASAALGVQLLRPAPSSIEPAANSVALVDPRTNDIVASIPVGAMPVAVAYGERAVWVANAQDQTVSKIDPESRTVVKTIGVGAPPASLALNSSELWVATGSAGTVVRFDARSGTLLQTLDLGGSGLAVEPVFSLTSGFGSVWAGGGRAVVRLEPRTGRVRSRIPTPEAPVALVAGVEAVWVALADGNVLRLDPQSEQVTGTVETGSGPIAMTAGHGSIWVSNDGGLAGDHDVWRIDEPTGSIRAVIAVESPRGVASTADAVYVAHGRGDVARIDPRSNRVLTTTRLGRLPFDLTSGEGMLWVAMLDSAAAVSP